MANVRRDVSKEQGWREVLARHLASGLSVREFCRRESLAESAFHSWRRTIAQRDGQLAARRRQITARNGQVPVHDGQIATRSPAAGPLPLNQPQVKNTRLAPAFVPAIVAPVAGGDSATIGTGAEACAGAIMIELIGGRVLRLPASIDVARIAELVHALEARGAR